MKLLKTFKYGMTYRSLYISELGEIYFSQMHQLGAKRWAIQLEPNGLTIKTYLNEYALWNKISDDFVDPAGNLKPTT